MSKLVLVRHGLSEYNKKGIWTGWDNPPLAPEGFEQARKTGSELKDIHFDFAYSADLTRAIQTLEEILKIIGQEDLTILQNKKLRERDYGDYTGKNKWQVKEEIGEDAFMNFRRSWNHPPPNGESLKMVYEREIPYFQEEIEPKLKDGKNIIIASSGNSHRAIVKYLENISDNDISKLEIGTGEAYVYELNNEGKVINKEIRGQNPNKGKV